jgi:tryptophan synthase alpha chain
MHPIHAAFERLRRSGRKALIPFIMGGDPDLTTTTKLLIELEAAGADLIEVGIPFSDPLADGPVIQEASARALRRGATPPRVLAAIAAASRRLHIPVVALSYWNPIVQFGGRANGGPDAFVRAARRSGVSGVIVPDVPVDESAPLRACALRAGVSPILLAAPTSPPERLRAVARASDGFIYYVSVLGTTGARRQLPPTLVHGVRQLRVLTTKPICVGFGISTASQAARVAAIADGVIVGSALIQAMQRARGPRAAVRAAAAFVRRLRQAM